MIIENIVAAADALFTVPTMALMVLGVAAGLIAGAIPGFTITMAIVLTLPFTFGMSPIQGLATMLGVFVGGLSGGLMAGILTGIPGTPSSVATTFDGFPMARKGRPGLALGIGVWASFFGGVISAILLMTLAPQLARIGLEFGPWDFFALVMFALTITASLSGDNLVKPSQPPGHSPRQTPPSCFSMSDPASSRRSPVSWVPSCTPRRCRG